MMPNYKKKVANNHKKKKNHQNLLKNKNLKTGTKKKKKKSNILDEAHMQVQMGIFVIYSSDFFHLIFSPFLGENFLVDPKRKHPDLTILFPSPPPNQTPSKIFYSFSLSLSLSL